MTEIDIAREPIELYKLLKLAGMASSGGEAKTAISDGLVTVNGEIETRKRKQIRSGDVITFAEESIRVRLRPESGTTDPI